MGDNPETASRRRWLKVCGSVSVVGIAGCLGGGEDDSEDDPNGDPNDDPNGELPFFEVVDIKPTTLLVGPDDSAEVAVDVENTGGEVGEQSVTVTVAETVLADSSLSIEPGQRETVVFENVQPGTDVGEYTLTVSSADDSASIQLRVREENMDRALDYLYVGTTEGTVYALEAATGRIDWTFETAGPVHSSPALAGNKLYVGSDDGSIYALDVHDGTMLSAFDAGGRVRSSPSVLDDSDGIRRVYIGDEGGSLTVLGPNLITAAWAHEADGEIYASPALEEDMFYYGAVDQNFYGVGRRAPGAPSGSEQWAHSDTGHHILSTAAIAGETAYVGSQNFRVYAYDTQDGEVQWKFPTEGAVFSSPAVHDGVVYVGSNDGNLYAIDSDTGDELWQYPTDDWVRSSPAVRDGIVYVGSNDGTVYAVDAETGDREWEFETGGPVRSSPALRQEVVYIGSGDGNFYALEADTGDEVWSQDIEFGLSLSSAVGFDDGWSFVSRPGRLYNREPLNSVQDL